MACSAYLCADWVWLALKRMEWRKWPVAALATWWCVDGNYWAYWSLVRPEAMFREGQWPMSLCLFLLAGFSWTTSLADWQQALGRFRSSSSSTDPETRA